MRNKGFTLTELMIVVMLLGIIAAFAIPSYDKYLRHAHETSIVINLIDNLQAANWNKWCIEGKYFRGKKLNISEINEGLHIDIIPGEEEYTYSSEEQGQVYLAFGRYKDFTVAVNQIRFDQANTPCCYEGQCPTLPVCHIEVFDL